MVKAETFGEHLWSKFKKDYMVMEGSKSLDIFRYYFNIEFYNGSEGWKTNVLKFVSKDGLYVYEYQIETSDLYHELYPHSQGDYIKPSISAMLNDMKINLRELQHMKVREIR